MKYSRLFPLLLAWEGIVWLGYNSHLLRTQVWILFDMRTIYEGFYIGSSFYNAESYMLVLAITSVMVMEYCLKEEYIPILLRCRTRMDFVRRRWKTLLAVSLMYVFVHFVLGYGLSFALFDDAFTNTRPTYVFYLTSAPLLFLFFLRVNVVYVLLRDFFQKKIFAMAGMLALYIAEYFIGYYMLEGVWLPCMDVDMGRAAYFGHLGGMEIVMAFVRQSGITVIAAGLSMKYFERKDVIEIER